MTAQRGEVVTFVRHFRSGPDGDEKGFESFQATLLTEGEASWMVREGDGSAYRVAKEQRPYDGGWAVSRGR